MLAVQNDTFDPVLLSLQENEFVVAHLGKPPAVVQRVTFPAGVNPKAVMPVIEKVYELIEVEKHDKQPWIGIDAIKKRCQTYLEQSASWAELKRRNGPKWPAFPSMASWDAKGRPTLGATGSDSGQVRTYFDENGDRQPFAVSLHGEDGPAFMPPWVKSTPIYDALITGEKDTEGFLRCPICQHSETYNPEAQSARNSANARMAKHLVSAKEKVESHRELHTKVYGR